jgi:hypothetical protein
MAQRRRPAKEVARRRPGGYWIDHAEITDDDASWLEDVTQLTLWNVTMPPDFLGRLAHLRWLDIRGGSGEGLSVRHARSLEYLAVNQVRGLADVSEIALLPKLRYLDLYGLAKLSTLPSLGKLSALNRINIGQMRSLSSFSPLLDAPNLKELMLIRKIAVSPADLRRIQEHPALEAFDWFAEDVPVKVWMPVLDQIKLPKTSVKWPEEWFAVHKDDPGPCMDSGSSKEVILLAPLRSTT